MTDSLRGKNVLIVGASSGIGAALATYFSQLGARLVLGARRETLGEALVAEITERGGHAHFCKTDVRDSEDCKRLVAQCTQRLGSLDVAVNCAGIAGEVDKSLQHSSLEVWQDVLRTNLDGTYYAMRAELEAMTQGGAIVNLSSLAGLKPFANAAAYVTSKHGIVGLTQVAALENAPRGIRVNAVCPGLVRTPLSEESYLANEESENALVARYPMGRIATMAEVVEAIVWLCSDASSFVNGVAMPVDGGARLS